MRGLNYRKLPLEIRFSFTGFLSEVWRSEREVYLLNSCFDPSFLSS